MKAIIVGSLVNLYEPLVIMFDPKSIHSTRLFYKKRVRLGYMHLQQACSQIKPIFSFIA